MIVWIISWGQTSRETSRRPTHLSSSLLHTTVSSSLNKTRIRFLFILSLCTVTIIYGINPTYVQYSPHLCTVFTSLTYSIHPLMYSIHPTYVQYSPSHVQYSSHLRTVFTSLMYSIHPTYVQYSPSHVQYSSHLCTVFTPLMYSIHPTYVQYSPCLLYTSDAADE